jgi:hypothetical protein
MVAPHTTRAGNGTSEHRQDDTGRNTKRRVGDCDAVASVVRRATQSGARECEACSWENDMNRFAWTLLSVFFADLTAAGEGWSSPRELQGSKRHPNSSDSDFRVACRFLYEQSVDLENWITSLDLSDPVWHCGRLILAVLFPRPANRRSFTGCPVDKLSVVIAIVSRNFHGKLAGINGPVGSK